MTVVLNDAAYAQALSEYQPRPIHDDAENERATATLERISEIEKPTPEQLAIAEILVTLIEVYEEERYAINASTPLSRLQELMLANDLKQKDLVAIIGSKGITSEVLHGRREISKTMAHKFGARFNVSHTIFL